MLNKNKAIISKKKLQTRVITTPSHTELQVKFQPKIKRKNNELILYFNINEEKLQLQSYK